MMKLIYVVDDERLVLDTMVFVLSSIEPEWQVRGFCSPLEALAAVQAQPPDLVLSDQRMPGLQGSQLLEKVRSLAPVAVRIIMSGYIDSVRLSEIASAHLYLCKPFDIQKLKATLEGTFLAQARLQDGDLLKVVTGLHSLPSIPHVYHALLRDLEDPRNSLSTIAETITGDAGISAKVLQLSNSPLFGQGSLVSNPVDAVLCLGTEMIKAVVLTQKLAQYYAKTDGVSLDLARLWQHCWNTAQLAKHLCHEKGLSQMLADEAFLAGLLCELGVFILSDNYPQRFERACEAAHEKGLPLELALTECFHTSSGSIAAYLLQLWGMPPEVITAVAHRHAPQAEAHNGFTVTTALYVADTILWRKSPPASFKRPEWNMNYLEGVGCAKHIPEWERLDPKAKS